MNNTMSPQARILVVDDEPLVVEAIERTLRSYGYAVCSAHSAQEALHILEQQRVNLCLSDLHMPGMGGKTLARWVRQQYPNIPVVIMTGDDSLEVLREAIDSGASDFITKPWRSHELPIVVERNLRRHQIWMEEQKRYLCKLNEAYSDMLEALLSALETREREIEGHCERVTTYTMILAEAMGVPHEKHPDIERGALLHDVGKIGIPDAILFKNGPLNAGEWQVMRQHPVIGYRMCMKVRSLQNAARDIVLCHHEQWDGSGYPQGLRGEDIPLGARIFAVADTLDAMTSDRPYRKALSLDEACAELERCAGTQFDPQVVKTFLSIPASVWETVTQNLQTTSRTNMPDGVVSLIPTEEPLRKAA
ncbi:MAG: two-component system response regulator [Armatimonadota bacterium]|nr:MAG: two-component system response regulator [Armatimonadota bacterium]